VKVLLKLYILVCQKKKKKKNSVVEVFLKPHCKYVCRRPTHTPLHICSIEPVSCLSLRHTKRCIFSFFLFFIIVPVCVRVCLFVRVTKIPYKDSFFPPPPPPPPPPSPSSLLKHVQCCASCRASCAACRSISAQCLSK
jgi:hypothetical protein